MAKFIFIRHGESLLNIKNVYFGHLNPDLTSIGEKSILNLANDLSKIVKDYEIIYTSPSLRCVHSAEILNFLNKPIITDESLMEINFGLFEGLSINEIVQNYPNDFSHWEKEGINFTFPSGESIIALSKRAINFIENLKSNSKTYIVVTHFGVINSIFAHYISDDIKKFWNYKPELASYSILEFNENFWILKKFSNK